MGGYLRDFRKLLDAHGLEASLYGHFGQGCVHCGISFDLMTATGVRRYIQFINEAADLVVRYGGSLSGEHGDGQSRAILLPKMYGPELMDAFREFKRIWDPEWKMNPGKVIDPYAPDQHLRLGGTWNPWTPPTHFHFPEDAESFPRATLRCVGVGKCRRTSNAFMCPSYLATREELHTTRGRAHMLFEMFEGKLIRDGWRSHEVKESLDLCLGCKGCKSECPVNVDVATYKAEFLSHFFEGRLRPREHYAMGLIDTWARWGSRFPGLANFFGGAPGLRALAKALADVHPKRRLPRFAPEPFTRWFHRRSQVPPVAGEQVLIYPDVFHDSFHPESLRAMTEVLETLGFRVLLPGTRVPEVRPLIHYGFLGQARRKLERALDVLHEHIGRDTPILFAEPSTASVFRDDVRSLMPASEDGRRIQRLGKLLGEFLEERKLEVPRLEGKVVFHAHCHEKAVLNAEASRAVLRRMGLELIEPQAGCCGMAGSFGFERRHYDISQKIGEAGLLPAVRREAGAAYVVADGFSCRTQIEQGTGCQPLHLAELLHHAFQRAAAPGQVLHLAKEPAWRRRP